MAIEHRKPDLIVCDIQMPEMDGYALLSWLRANPALRDTPVVAVTALAMVGDRERILAAGFDGYLAKPIVPESFAEDVGVFLPARADRPAHAGRPLVLIVDNLQANLDLADVVLDHLGYRTMHARGMVPALQILRAGGRRPALILSDVSMDDGDGFMLLESVRSDVALRDIPLILITSTAYDSKSRARGLALGADRYLFRPIEPDALRAEIEACLTARRSSP
jgi:two-component system cell cycle response regulator